MTTRIHDEVIMEGSKRDFMWCILFWRCTSMITSAEVIWNNKSQIDERFQQFLNKRKGLTNAVRS